MLLGRSERHQDSLTLWRELTAEAAERADPDVVRCLFFRAQTEMTSGSWHTAEQLCVDAIPLARQSGLEMFEPCCLSILAELAAYRGESEKARREIPELLQVVETGQFRLITVRLRIALAVLELSYDDGDASWRHVAQLFDDAEEMDVYLGRVAGSAGIEALIAIGDLLRAERLLTQIDRRAADGDAALHPLVLRSRGLLLAAQGDRERAIASLEAAAVAHETPQGVNPFELGRTLLALGTAQRQAQHKRDARDSLQRAAEIFDRLGAAVWSERARSEVSRIGGRPANEGDLTPSERRIAELVAAGKTNKEVAATLFLSVHTIEGALKRAYRKLGVRSRTELSRVLDS